VCVCVWVWVCVCVWVCGCVCVCGWVCGQRVAGDVRVQQRTSKWQRIVPRPPPGPQCHIPWATAETPPSPSPRPSDPPPPKLGDKYDPLLPISPTPEPPCGVMRATFPPTPAGRVAIIGVLIRVTTNLIPNGGVCAPGNVLGFKWGGVDRHRPSFPFPSTLFMGGGGLPPDEFDILQMVGAGGIGKVYRVVQRATGRTLAPTQPPPWGGAVTRSGRNEGNGARGEFFSTLLG